MALPINLEKLINGRIGDFLKEMHLYRSNKTDVTKIKD
jgi:hypothetical protein